MAPIRTSYAWLGVRWTLAKDRDWRDRGEGPVSYLAVLLLISLIAAAIIGTGVAGDIAGYIKGIVTKVGTGKSA
jgi:hypothetical protein